MIHQHTNEHVPQLHGQLFKKLQKVKLLAFKLVYSLRGFGVLGFWGFEVAVAA